MNNKKYIRNFVWNMIGITFNSIYSMILILFITRYNSSGITYAGQFAYAFYISSFFSTIGTYGGRILQISDVKKKYSENCYISLKYISDIIMIFLSIIFILINGYSFEKILLVMSMIIYRSFEAISDGYYGVMQKNDNLELIGKSMTIKAFLSTILFVLLYYKYNNLIISCLSFVVVYLLVLIFLDRYYCKKNYRIEKITITKETFKLLKDSTIIFLFSFLTLFIANISRYFVDLRLDDIAQGYFSIIILPASLITLLAQFLIQPFLNNFVYLNKNNEIIQYQKKSYRLIFSLFILGIIISILMYYIGSPILELIFNIDLSKYYIYISLLIISGICNGAVSIISNLLTILDKIKIQLVLFIVPIFITIIYSVISIHTLKDSLNSYMFLMLTEFILFFLYYTYLVKKEVKIKNEKS